MLLLRAGLIYCLTVASIIFGVVAFWQRLEIGAHRQNVSELALRIERLQRDLKDQQIKVESAERRAAVAEDSAERAATRQPRPDDNMRFNLAGDLAAALQERDAARSEALKLAADLENAQRALKEANDARDAAVAEAQAARAQNDALTAAAAAALAAQPGVAAHADPAAGAQKSESARASASGAEPATGKQSQVETSSLPDPASPKAALPATVKPASTATKPQPAPKKAAAKPQPRKAAAKPQNKSAQDSSFLPF